MSLRWLLRKPILPSSLSHLHHSPLSKPRTFHRVSPLRLNSTSSSPNDRLSRILNRLPRFLHPYTNALRTAPVSHIVSFLILHEITAIVPLVGLAGLFHYMEWVPKTMVARRWLGEGMERFERYFGRKGWFGFERLEAAGEGVAGGQGRDAGTGNNGEMEGEETGRQDRMLQETEKRWHVGEKGGRILVEVATAYAITKVLLPVRILVSVWGTPWFARVIVGRVGGLFGRGKGRVGIKSARTGTGVTSGGAVTRGREGPNRMP